METIITHMQNVDSIFSGDEALETCLISRPGGCHKSAWRPLNQSAGQNGYTSRFSIRKPNPCNDHLYHSHVSESLSLIFFESVGARGKGMFIQKGISSLHVGVWSRPREGAKICHSCPSWFASSLSTTTASKPHDTPFYWRPEIQWLVQLKCTNLKSPWVLQRSIDGFHYRLSQAHQVR